MDQSARRLPDLALAAPNLVVSNPDPSNHDRRRRVRQKLHTPVYASFNGSQSGLVVDLSELIDLHEEGFAVQTSERLETHRAITLCLDLPETRSFIHGTGEVIWSDDSGRGGVRFAHLSQSSSKALKEWLFANLLIGCSNHAARSEQLARREDEYKELGYHHIANSASVEFADVLHTDSSRSEPSRIDILGLQSTRAPRPSAVVSISDHTDRTPPVETLRSEVREIQGDIDAVLQLITGRALTLTGASGAALACLNGDIMICCARAGEPAPPLGAAVDVSHGLSGECVRTGRLVSCEDAENDPRLDPDVGRALNIASLMAVPIVSDFRVVGLLEIFSPIPHCFTQAHGRILEHLVETIPTALIVSSSPQVHQPVPTNPQAPHDLSPPAVPEPEATDTYSLDDLRSAFRNPDTETGNPLQRQVFVADFAALIQAEEAEYLVGPAHDPVPEPNPKTRSRLVYRALIGLVIAVVVVVVGYLLGPLIEKHRLAASPSGESSLIQAAEAAWHPVPAHPSLQPASLPELRKLADQGDPDAQWQMGVRYHNGEDVPQDEAQAMSWFERAADQGQVDAQSHLGAYYWAGRGVPKNVYKAYFWSAIATAQGDEISKARLEGLASQMTRQQVAAARQEAETWIHTHSQRGRSEAN